MKKLTILLGLLALAVALVLAEEKTDDTNKESKDSTKMEEKKDSAKADTAEKIEWITTKTGLKYVDLAVGEGDAITNGNTVKIHYTLWLSDANGNKGKMIQSSKETGQPYTTPIPGRLIAAWNEGVPGMKVGGRRLLLSPPELAYGASGMGGMIPPNATLYFELECVEIVK